MVKFVEFEEAFRGLMGEGWRVQEGQLVRLVNWDQVDRWRRGEAWKRAR